MAQRNVHKLQDFYDQALLTPALLCLSCSRSHWNHRGQPCSPSRREDCALFVNSMVNRLASEPEPTAPRRTGQRPRHLNTK